MAQQKIDRTTPKPGGKFGDDIDTITIKINANIDDLEQQLAGKVDDADITAETQARVAADQLLQQNIDAKASDLAAEVTARQNAVSSEATARANADNLLASRVGIMQGFKNKVINGDFRYWQRGTNFAAATGPRFTADRWYAVGTGTTIAVAQGSAYSVSQLPNSRSTLLAAVNSVAGAANVSYLQTKIEGVETLAGGNATFSVKARCASGTFRVGVELAQNFGQGGSAQVNTIGQAIVLTTAWQTFTFTVALPSVTGKTIGVDNSLQLTLWLDAGSNIAARSFNTGQKSGNVEFAELQLESGSVATSFEFLPDAISLPLVQRYYEKSFSLTTTPAQNAGTLNARPITQVVSAGTSQFGCMIPYKVEKRSNTVAVTFYNPAANNAFARNANTGGDCSSTGVGGESGSSILVLAITSAPGSSPGQSNIVHFTADAELP